MADFIAKKRIIKDIQILQKNRDDLNARGIYFYVDEQNMFDISFLIIPKHKQDITNDMLVSPYTGGMFLFKLKIPYDFPLEPPAVTFHPKQNYCRLHPNYYEIGKVCLSMLNTWGSQDWCPSMSIMSLANVLEERFNERSLCFEPGNESSTDEELRKFNKSLRFAVYKIAICDVLEKKYTDYSVFSDVISEHWQKHKTDYIDKITPMISQAPVTYIQQRYNHKIRENYKEIYDRLILL